MRKVLTAILATAMSVSMALTPMAAGWYQVGSEWYYKNKKEQTVKDTWAKSGNHWCYLGSDGKMVKSQWVEGKYYVDENGIMLRDTTTPDGYRVGVDGRWIQNGDGNYNVSSADSAVDALETIRFANSDTDWDAVFSRSKDASEIGFLYSDKVYVADRRLPQVSDDPKQFIGGQIVFYDDNMIDSERVGNLVAETAMDGYIFSSDRYKNQRFFFFANLLIGLDRALTNEQVHQYIDPIYHRYGNLGYEVNIRSFEDFSFDEIVPIF